MTYNIYSLIETIRKRTGMYTGKISLNHLASFLGGYEMAMAETGATGISHPEFSCFHNWIAKKFGYNESTAGWPNMILAVSIGYNPQTVNWENFDKGLSDRQHMDSVSLFFELLDEYRAGGSTDNKR